MAYIRYVPRTEAGPALRELYERYARPGEEMDNIIRIHGLNPASLRGHLDLYLPIMKGRTPLSPARREMIAVRVSAINRCRY